MIIIALILLPQLIGTVEVIDESRGLDDSGCPVTSTTYEDLEAPGTVFGTLTITEWQDALEKRFPKGVLRQYNTVSDSYQGLEAGETDAAWLDFGASVLPFIYVGPNRYFGNFIDI